MQYNTSYGEFLVVVGNTKDLGQWDVAKGVRLDWTHGNIWRGAIAFCHKCQENCEYKYVVCRENKSKSMIETVRWEEGPNRMITFQKIRKLVFVLNDLWGLRKISLRVPNNLESGQALKIIGDIPQLGEFQKPQDMKLVYKKGLNSDIKDQYWQFDFLMEPFERRLFYSYFIYDEENDKYLYEKKQIRRVNLCFSHENINSPSSQRICPKKFVRKNNCLKIYDKEFEKKFCFDEINENILLGPCPQSKEEVELLQEKGVQAILNLQRESDMEKMNIDINTMKSIYDKKNIDFVNYQIEDKTPDKISSKIIEASAILNEMLQKFKKVYVHCTAGKIRSPYTVMVYLCLYKGISLSKSIEIMKIKRPIAFIKKTMLLKIIHVHHQVNNFCLFV